jgi:hypothetical protein
VNTRALHRRLTGLRSLKVIPEGEPKVSAEEWTALEAAILADAPPGALIIGASVSPSGQQAAALTLLPSAHYLMDDLFVRTSNGWEGLEGGSGGGVSWSFFSDDEIGGVLRYGDEAPEDAQTVVIEYEGTEYRLPVRHGHFLFVAWDTPFAQDPKLIRFE